MLRFLNLLSYIIMPVFNIRVWYRVVALQCLVAEKVVNNVVKKVC